MFNLSGLYKIYIQLNLIAYLPTFIPSSEEESPVYDAQHFLDQINTDVVRNPVSMLVLMTSQFSKIGFRMAALQFGFYQGDKVNPKRFQVGQVHYTV